MKLFRYRRPTTNTFAELAEGVTWYSRYDELNDPFEGVYVNKSGEGAFDYLIRQFRVCSFSRRRDCLLLWAHYAENHRGLCLEYEVADDVYRGQFFPVTYTTAQPVLEAVRRYPADVPAAGTLAIDIDREAAVFLTKSADWSYEEERRLLRFAEQPDAKGEKHPVPGMLCAVYVGLRADASTLLIVDRLLSSQRDVDLWQASLVPGSFQLQFCLVKRRCTSTKG